MRKIIKASNTTRDRAVDLQEFLIGQGVSEHDMLIEVFKKLSADDAVEILEDIAKDYDIPLEENIESSTNITASRKTEDEWRAEYFRPEVYPHVDPKRLSDMLAVDWGGSVSAEDSEYFVYEYELFPDFSVIESIDYARQQIYDRLVRKYNYGGAYVVKYKDGTTRYFAWKDYPHNDEMEEVTDLVVEKLEGEPNTSTVSFDFIHDGDYDGNEIIDTVMDIIRNYGGYPLGGSFEEVDYSGYDEYAHRPVSQCNVDFEWEDDYDADAIEDEIGIALMPYEIIGLQFNSVGD